MKDKLDEFEETYLNMYLNDLIPKDEEECLAFVQANPEMLKIIHFSANLQAITNLLVAKGVIKSTEIDAEYVKVKEELTKETANRLWNIILLESYPDGEADS